MTCRDFVQFLMEYEEGTLRPAEREIFEQHMRDCPPCEVYLDSYRETVRLGRDVCGADDAVPEDVPEELVAAILAARRRG